MNLTKKLKHITADLAEGTDLIQSNPMQVAFLFGAICTNLENIIEYLEQKENERHGC